MTREMQLDTLKVTDITTLNTEIKGIVTRQNELRKAIDEIVANLEGALNEGCEEFSY